MGKTSVSKKSRGPSRVRRKDTFLPGPGQGSSDEGADFVIQCVVVCLQTGYAAVATVAVPLWALVRYVCWDGWRAYDAARTAKKGKPRCRRPPY